MKTTTIAAAALALACTFTGSAQAAPPTVEMTWMSIANWYFRIGDQRILMDGYITRIPEAQFTASPVYPKDLYTYTTAAYGIDMPSVTRVRDAVLGTDKLDLLLVGHSHWDHSWDTPAWSKLTGAPMIGGASTCMQAAAQGVMGAQCRSVSGGEKIALGNGITMRVVRWNHSGDTDQPDPAFPARALPPAGARRGDRRLPCRRRRGLPERRRQPGLPVHGRQRGRAALLLRQQLGQRLRPRQGHRRRRRQLRLADRQPRRGDEGRGAHESRCLDRHRRHAGRGHGRAGDPARHLPAQPLGRPLQSVLARHALSLQGRRAARLSRRPEGRVRAADAVLRQVRALEARRRGRRQPCGQEQARLLRHPEVQPGGARRGDTRGIDQRRRRLRRGLRGAGRLGRRVRRPRSLAEGDGAGCPSVRPGGAGRPLSLRGEREPRQSAGPAAHRRRAA